MNIIRENRLVILLVFFTLAAFFRKFSVPFIWDDFPFILENNAIQDISFIWRYFYEDIALLYRPLRQVFTTLCYFAFGENPIGYHVAGILLHIGTVLTLFACLNRMFENRTLNFFAVLLFALHPVHAERVLLITGSFDLLGDLLTLLAFYFYLLSTQEKATAKRTYSLLLFFLALLSSENALILLPLIVVYEFIFGKALFWRKESITTFCFYLAVFLGYFYVRWLTIQTVARSNDMENYFSLLFSMPQVFLQYLHITFFPIHLSVYRAPLLPDSDFFITNILSCGIIFSLLVFAFWEKTPKELRFTILWFFVCLIPVSNIIPTGNIMEERYLYLPSFSFSLFFLSIVSLFIRRERFAYGLLSVLSLLLCALLIHKSSFYLAEKTKWLKDVQTFHYLYPSDYETTLKYEAKVLDVKNPMNREAKVRSIAQASTFYNAANLVRIEDGCKKAEELYRMSLVLNPLNPAVWHNLYNCDLDNGATEDLMQALEKLANDKKTTPKIKVDAFMTIIRQRINDNNPAWRTYVSHLYSLPLSEKQKFELYRNLGVGEYRDRYFKKALYFLRKALEIQNDAEIKERIAELEEVLSEKAR